MKIIIAGSRDICDYELVKRAISSSGFSPITEVVSGGANGVDFLGERWAKENNVPLKIFPADWKRHGKAAGPIRNTQMAEYAEALIAVLWKNGSVGTENMINQATKAGYIKIYVVRV